MKKNNSMLEVSIPSRGTIDTNKATKVVYIDFDGLFLKADSHVIEMKDFNIILGKDWMGSNRATIIYFQKDIVSRRHGEEEFRFVV